MNDTDIIEFWFETLSPKQWFYKDEALDVQIKSTFSAIHAQAANNELAEWRVSDEGRLAEIIVLDQFSRNMFRGEANTFAYDELALSLTKMAVETGAHTRLEQAKINFLLMPFMHSESLREHELAVPLFEQYTSAQTLEFELRHKTIIEQFGRYPHRNELLGRKSTEDEESFLHQPGSSF